MKKRYNISIEEDVKTAFEEEVSTMGLSMSSAIEIFMRAVVGQHCIPFPIGSYGRAPIDMPATEVALEPAPEPANKPERIVERSGKKNKGKKKK